MHRAMFVSAVALLATLRPTPVQAAACPEFPFDFGAPPEDCGVCSMPALPELDCAVDSTCCTSGALDPDLDLGELCDEAIAFTAVQSSCPDDFDAHIQLFGMDEWSWQDNGLRQCDGTSPFGRHWVAANYLAAAIDGSSGLAHHRGSQYLMAAQANATDFHPQLEHRLSPGLKAYAALWTWDGAVADTIRFACRAFARSGSAETLSANFLHEAWHSVYGGHDVDAVVDDDKVVEVSADHYYAHEIVGEPPRIDAEFDPDAWTTDDKPGKVIHSVYQIQHEYLCDLVRSPRKWVPRVGLFEAAESAGSIINNNTINMEAVPAWALCSSGEIPVRTRRDPSLPDGARLLEISLEGVVVETSQGGVDDDTEAFATSRTVVVVPGGGVADVGNSLIGTFADGEVWLEIQLNASLAADGDTVDFDYNLLFFEDDADDTDCDQDLGGDNCPAALDPSLWRSASVDSTSLFYLDTVTLSNVTADPGTDVADIVMNVELSW